MPLSKARDKERKRQQVRLENEKFQPKPPLYNPSLHRVGDVVRVKQGKQEIVTTIPSIDADGNAYYEG